ncbi:MAG TPA: hypothetical protein VN814_17150 [Caulobacteraceae bacterium]|nr:hypothetical protein [Caulobacteraceae bacterium]
MSDTSAATESDIHQMLKVINQDLRGANALARACLAGLAATSAEARQAIAQALASKDAMAADELSGGWDSEAFVARTSQQLDLATPAHERLCEAMERALVQKAALIEDDEDLIRRRA